MIECRPHLENGLDSPRPQRRPIRLVFLPAFRGAWIRRGVTSKGIPSACEQTNGIGGSVQRRVLRSFRVRRPRAKARLREASYLHSSSREALIAHVFVAEVLQEAWFAREQLVDVPRSEVDAAGYDIVFECGNILRHVQLKASESGGKTSRQTINARLREEAWRLRRLGCLPRTDRRPSPRPLVLVVRRGAW